MADPLKVEFVNRTSQNIILIWLKREKERYLYVDIGPSKSARIITYIGHTWIAVDKKYGRKLAFYEWRRDKQNNNVKHHVTDHDLRYRVTAKCKVGQYHTIYVCNTLKRLEDICIEYLIDCRRITENLEEFEKLRPFFQHNIYEYCQNNKYYIFYNAIIARKLSKLCVMAGSPDGNDEINSTNELSADELGQMLDQELENKAKKFNMTAIQVRSLLYNVLRDKRVITLAQAKARDTTSSGESASTNNTSELLQLLELDLPFTRLRSRKQPHKTTDETHDSSEDTSYEPSEMSSVCDDTEEDDFSEFDLDMKSDDKFESSKALESDDDSCSKIDEISEYKSEISESSCSFLEQQKSIQNTQKLWKNWIFELGDDSLNLNVSEFGKLSTSHNNTITSIDESDLNNLCDVVDKNTLEKQGKQSLPESMDEDEEDEDFVYDMDELEDDDVEEYRQDKAVRVSKKEYLKLMETTEDNIEVDINSFFILANENMLTNITSENPPPVQKLTAGVTYQQELSRTDPAIDFNISLDDNQRSTINLLLQQHVILLTTMCIQSSLCEEFSEIYKSSKSLIEEFVHFMPKTRSESSKNTVVSPNNDSSGSLEVRAFANIGAQEALETIDIWNTIKTSGDVPVVFDDRLDRIHQCKMCNIHQKYCVGGVFNIPYLYTMDYPPLPLKMISFFMLSPIFGKYPQLLPRVSANNLENIRYRHYMSLNSVKKAAKSNVAIAADLGVISNDKNRLELCAYRSNVKYTTSEDYLIILGYYQWDNHWPTIQLNLLPTRNYTHMRARFYNHTRSLKIPNGDIFNLPTSHIVQKLSDFKLLQLEENANCALFFRNDVNRNTPNLARWVYESKISGLMEFVHLRDSQNLICFCADYSNESFHSKFSVVSLNNLVGCVTLNATKDSHTKKYSMGTTLLPFASQIVDPIKPNSRFPNKRFQNLDECCEFYVNKFSGNTNEHSSIQDSTSVLPEAQSKLNEFLESCEFKNEISELIDYINWLKGIGDPQQDAINLVHYMTGSTCIIDKVRFWTNYLQDYKNINLLQESFNEEKVNLMLQLLSNMKNINMEQFIKSIDIDWDKFSTLPFKSSVLEPSIFELKIYRISEFIKGESYCKLDEEKIKQRKIYEDWTDYSENKCSSHFDDQLQTNNINPTLNNPNDSIITKYQFLKFDQDRCDLCSKKNTSSEKGLSELQPQTNPVLHNLIKRIKPSIKLDKWTPEKDTLILNQVNSHGYNAKTFGIIQKKLLQKSFNSHYTLNEIHDRYIGLVIHYCEKINNTN